MKKILAVTNTLNPNKSTGKFWNNLLKNFNSEDIDLICIRDKKINVPFLFKLLRLSDFYLSYKNLKNIDLNKYNLLFNDLGSADWLILFRYKELLRKNNIKIINLVRNSAWNYIDGYLRTKKIKDFFKLIYVYFIFILFKERIVSKRANKIITVSEYSKFNLLKNKINKNKIKVISNAIEINLFKFLNKKKELRKELDLDLEKFYLIFVGRFTYDKGRDIIISVMDILQNLNKDIELLIVDDNNFKGDLPKNIKYLGKVKNKELVKYYNTVDCMFFPTLYEGDSLAILEAASSGIPLISSNTGGLWELKKNNKILQKWIVDVGNSKNIINKYINLILKLNNKKIYKELKREWSMWGRKKDINNNMKVYYNEIKN